MASSTVAKQNSAFFSAVFKHRRKTRFSDKKGTRRHRRIANEIYVSCGDIKHLIVDVRELSNENFTQSCSFFPFFLRLFLFLKMKRRELFFVVVIQSSESRENKSGSKYCSVATSKQTAKQNEKNKLSRAELSDESRKKVNVTKFLSIKSWPGFN